MTEKLMIVRLEPLDVRHEAFGPYRCLSVNYTRGVLRAQDEQGGTLFLPLPNENYALSVTLAENAPGNAKSSALPSPPDGDASDDAVESLPEILRPLARWIDEQHERGGIVGKNADTGEPVPESLGEYYRAWTLIRACEAAIRKPIDMPSLVRGCRIANYTDALQEVVVRRGPAVILRLGVVAGQLIQRNGANIMRPNFSEWNTELSDRLVGAGLSVDLSEGLSIEWW